MVVSNLLDNEKSEPDCPLKRLLLSIKAELENVTDLVPASDAFEYFFQACLFELRISSTSTDAAPQVECNSCHEVHPKFIGINRLVHDIAKHRLVP